MKRKIFAAAFAVCLLACSAVNVFASTGVVGGNGLYMNVYLESMWGTIFTKSYGSTVCCVDAEASDDDMVYAEGLRCIVWAYDKDGNPLDNDYFNETYVNYKVELSVESGGIKTKQHKATFTIYEDGRPRYSKKLTNNR